MKVILNYDTRKLKITEKLHSNQTENSIDTIEFTIPGELEGFAIELQLADANDDDIGSVLLTQSLTLETEEDFGLLEYIVPLGITVYPIVKYQIVASEAISETVWLSNIGFLYFGKALEVDGPIPTLFFEHTISETEVEELISEHNLSNLTHADIRQLIADIDISAPISDHNSAVNSHSDIRTSVSNITNGTTHFSKVSLDLLAAIAPGVGELSWDATYATLALGMGGGEVTQQIGQEFFVYAFNQTGSIIPNGSAVYLIGSTGDNPKIALSSATGNGESNVCGVTTEDIAHGSKGLITKLGFIHGLDTSLFQEGDYIYLGSTPGEITTTAPVKPATQVRIGVVVRSAHNGILFINPLRISHIRELSDVDTTNAIHGSGLYWNPTTSLWTPHTFWEDLRFPATAINPAGAATPATYDPDVIAFSFSASATNSIAVIAQMPHSWKIGSTIHPHIHWHPTTTDTGNVLWRMEYKWTNINDVESGSWTTIDMLVAGDGVANKHQIESFTAIAGTSKNLSSILKIKISRIGGDGTDTFGSAAMLDEFDIHYELDTSGSTSELVK